MSAVNGFTLGDFALSGSKPDGFPCPSRPAFPAFLFA